MYERMLYYFTRSQPMAIDAIGRNAIAARYFYRVCTSKLYSVIANHKNSSYTITSTISLIPNNPTFLLPCHVQNHNHTITIYRRKIITPTATRIQLQLQQRFLSNDNEETKSINPTIQEESQSLTTTSTPITTPTRSIELLPSPSIITNEDLTTTAIAQEESQPLSTSSTTTTLPTETIEHISSPSLTVVANETFVEPSVASFSTSTSATLRRVNPFFAKSTNSTTTTEENLIINHENVNTEAIDVTGSTVGTDTTIASNVVDDCNDLNDSLNNASTVSKTVCSKTSSSNDSITMDESTLSPTTEVDNVTAAATRFSYNNKGVITLPTMKSKKKDSVVSTAATTSKIKPKASNPTRYHSDAVRAKFSLQDNKRNVQHNHVGINGHNTSNSMTSLDYVKENDGEEVEQNNSSNSSKGHNKTSSVKFLKKPVKEILSTNKMNKQRVPPSPFVETKLLCDHLIAQGEKHVPVSTWVHIEGISPLSSLDTILASIQNALDVEEVNGIVDLDAFWNEKLPLPFVSIVDPTKIPEKQQADDHYECRRQHKWVRKAKLILSPFARPTGWYVQFDNRSIAYALLRHAQEHTIRCTWRLLHLREYRNQMKTSGNEDNAITSIGNCDPISYDNYLTNVDISDSTLRIENCPPNVKEASIFNFFSRYDLQASVGKNGDKPIQLWSGITTDGKITSPTTYLVHFADPSWARAALRDKQNTYMFQLGSPLMDYKNPKPLHIAQYAKQML